MNGNAKINIVIIDDSDISRKMIEESFDNNEKIHIIGSTSDISKGRDLILKLNPDTLILNIDKLRMKAVAFLRRLLSEISLPVIVLSSSTQKGKLLTLQALESGAIDFVFTPVNDILRKKEEIINLLNDKIKILSTANIPLWKTRNNIAINISNNNPNTIELLNKVIVIGTSIGGSDAITRIITQLPSSMPGIVVAMPFLSGLTKTFADRLNELSNMQVKEAENGDKITNGKVLISPGDFHLKIIRSAGRYKVQIENGEKINNHRPCIDILMTSIAEQASSNAIGVLLSGEGVDGSLGLKSIKDNGGTTIVQDKNTSIISDMPNAALELKVVDYQLPINEIAQHLIKITNIEI